MPESQLVLAFRGVLWYSNFAKKENKDGVFLSLLSTPLRKVVD